MHSINIFISIRRSSTHTHTHFLIKWCVCGEKFFILCSGVLTISSSLRRAYWGLPSLGGLDTWRCSESPLPTVSRHNTKATLSCKRLESKKKGGGWGKRKFFLWDAFGWTWSNHSLSRVDATRRLYSELLDLTCVVQIVFQPAFGALVVEFPSTGHKEEQVVPEDAQWVQERLHYLSFVFSVIHYEDTISATTGDVTLQ